MANDTEDLLDDSTEQNQSQPMAKIPKKLMDMSTCFNAVDERITFVPGWQPIARGSGLLITMPKSFKEKIWRNELFSYRELHCAMNRPKTSNSLKSVFNKLIEQEEISVPAEKDNMQLLDLNIYQLQFFTLYSQMYPQHAVSHMEHQLTLYTLIQQCKPLVQVLDEAWVSSDPVFTHLADAILANTKFNQDKHHQRKPNNNTFAHKTKPSKHIHKPKPKAAVSSSEGAVCFAFNGMSKNVQTCTHTNCSYPHKCAHCRGPHHKTECEKLK